ncbi:MAG: WecB/TagA/CpsF family glycosyltransferase [Treponema sp.]|nr:WecB/TagA/CpsF family glycosyltransferase [Candidatus Treponema equifaecale]
MNRIEIIGVPVDICRPEEMEAEILRILEKPGAKQIVFLSVWDLIKARNKKKDFGDCLRNADLVLPVSKSILKAAKFLKIDVPVRYNPFTAVIHFLNILDQHYKTLYMLGGRKKTLQTAERNVRDTYKNLHIVGRYVGYYPKNAEDNVVEAIRKASPSLAIVSEGIKEKNLWIYHRREKFSNSIFLYYRDCFGIFAKRIRRVNEKTFEKGHEIWNEIGHNPMKVFLIFPYIGFLLVVLWTRLFKKNNIQKGEQVQPAEQSVQNNQGQ